MIRCLYYGWSFCFATLSFWVEALSRLMTARPHRNRSDTCSFACWAQHGHLLHDEVVHKMLQQVNVQNLLQHIANVAFVTGEHVNVIG